MDWPSTCLLKIWDIITVNWKSGNPKWLSSSSQTGLGLKAYMVFVRVVVTRTGPHWSRSKKEIQLGSKSRLLPLSNSFCPYPSFFCPAANGRLAGYKAVNTVPNTFPKTTDSIALEMF